MPASPHQDLFASRRASAPPLQEMQKAIERMALAAGPVQFVEADVAFHEALGEAAGHGDLASLLRSLRPRLLKGMLIGTRLEGGRKANIEEHVAILAAIRHHDGTTARAIMEGLLRRGCDE